MTNERYDPVIDRTDMGPIVIRPTRSMRQLSDLRIAYRVLSAIVRDEYPAGMTLAEIARMADMPDVGSEEAIAALERLEAADKGAT